MPGWAQRTEQILHGVHSSARYPAHTTSPSRPSGKHSHGPQPDLLETAHPTAHRGDFEVTSEAAVIRACPFHTLALPQGPVGH